MDATTAAIDLAKEFRAQPPSTRRVATDRPKTTTPPSDRSLVPGCCSRAFWPSWRQAVQIVRPATVVPTENSVVDINSLPDSDLRRNAVAQAAAL